MVSIVVADDHKIVREGLIRLLEARDDFNVVGEASNGEEAVALVLEKQPDVVLMDINMPKLSGIDATRQLEKAGSRSKILNNSLDFSGHAARLQRPGSLPSFSCPSLAFPHRVPRESVCQPGSSADARELVSGELRGFGGDGRG